MAKNSEKWKNYELTKKKSLVGLARGTFFFILENTISEDIHPPLYII